MKTPHESPESPVTSTRRDFVGAAIAAGVGAILPGRPASADGRIVVPGGSRVDDGAASSRADFTFVHLTDMHVTRRRWGDKGYRACIESVRDLKPRPAFVLMGGDLAFDGCYTPKDDFEDQIRLYREISDGLGIPYHHCMGNHDVLGWSSRRKVPTTDPELGKKMIMDRLEWENSYYSFDHAGWHFAVLDSIYPKQFDHGPAYEPRIGPEQLEWLAYDLGAAGERPKVCVTHIAAFCNTGQIAADPNRKSMDGHMVLWDTKELRQVLTRHGVKALLQGHSHRVEEYRFDDVWYLTSPAVSGAWWAGSWTGNPPGYTIFRCKGGELTWQHHFFGWKTHLDDGDDLERRKIAEQHEWEQKQQKMLARERAGRRRARSTLSR